MEQVFSVADKLSKVIRNMQKCLQCTICLQTISDPVKTHCGHRFCRICIQTVIQNKNALCPLCNCTIQRRNISKDENTAIYIKQLQNIIEAIQLDSGIDIVTHLSVLNMCETSSNNTEDLIKPSCSYANDTRQKAQPTGNNNVKGKRKKGGRKFTQKKKIVAKESNSMTRYLSRCGLSGIEPLEASNDCSGEKSLEDKVYSWLDTLPENENFDPDVVVKVEHVDSDLDDTLTMSVSENDAPSKRITDTNVDPDLEPSTACDKSDGDRSTGKEIPEGCSRDDENDKKSGINVGNCSSRVDTKPDTKSKTVKSSDDGKGKSEEKFIEVQRTSPCDMLSAMQRNWSSVAKFGKEMRAKRKRLKCLDVSIEKRRSMGEVDREEEVGSSSDRRGGSKCEKSNVDEELLECENSLGATRYDGVEGEDRERSIVQPSDESSFVTLEGDGKIRIRNLNTCQMNAIIGVSDENGRIEGVEGEEEEEETERQMEVFNTPVHDRSKIFSQMIPEESHDDQDRANLVDESVKRSLPISTNERADEAGRSTPSRKRLSLKRQSEDSKSNNTSNSDVGSRLNAVRRDLNRQIDKEDVDVGNVDGITGRGKRKSTGEERERNLASNDYAGRRMGDKKRNKSLVTFKKLGKFYKRGNERRIKKRVPFFYLGATEKETSYYSGLHAHKSRDLVAMCCNARLEQEIKSGTSTGSITSSSGNVKNVAKERMKSKVKVDDRTVSENQVEDVAGGRICEEIIPRPIGNANKSYDVDVLLVSSDDEPSKSSISKTDSSCKDTVRMPSPSKDCPPARLLSSSPPIDTLQTQKLNEAEPEPARRKRKGDKSSFACISPQCNSGCASIEKRKCSIGNQRTFFHEKGAKESLEREDDDSTHSLSSQATCIRTTTPEMKNLSRKSKEKRSPNPSSRDTELIRTGENSDRDTVKTYEKKVREKVYNRIVLLDSSESESTDFAFLDGNGNDGSDASPKTEKRKRTASFDSADETDLNAIVSNWCNDGKLDERCKKKGKLERARDALDSSASNFSTKSLDLVVEKFGKEKSNSNWTKNLEDRMALAVDEDSPDFCAVIDKVQNVRNGTMVFKEKQRQENAKTADSLMHDNFDEIIANVNTADLIADSDDGKGDKSRREEYMEGKNDCERKSKQCSEKIRSWNNEIPHNGSDKENRNKMDVSGSDNGNDEDPVCVNNIQDVEHSGEEDDIVENTPKAKRKKLEAINSPRESLPSISKTIEKSAYVRTPSSIMTTGSNLASTPGSMTNIQPLHQSTPKVQQFKNITGIAKRISVMNEQSNSKQTKNIVQRIGSQKSASQRSNVQNITRTSIEQRINIQRSDLQNAMQRSDQRNSDQESNVQITSQRNNDQRSIVQHEIVERNDISSQRNTQKLCFVCSGLVLSEIEQVKTLAQKVNVKYRQQFDQEVTHVIVKADKDNSANKTLKYLQGVAHKKWIVGFDWVINSLKENRLVNEEPYEVVDSRTLEAGPRRSRLREKDLFTGFVFFCNGPYDNVSVQQYQDMLRATGAIVVQSLSALAAEKSRLRIIMIQADMYEYEIIKWYRMVHAISIVHEWVVECISQYKLISFYPYLQELSRQDVLALGYPEYLLEEEVDEDSDNSCDVSM
ncbi:uncharacterized protein LOC108003844 isoform X3 [Apis cerana]|uniref:uncharacterized protein LOC108003844 isoform X3 n=1 Tax=Apis cerana TaxID=7461 RepID=UPI002B228A58|nr:uncharacterized protein LOC108003844 isoform X3 [Apis cerana]